MHIQADKFLALTAMLAGFVPTGAGDRRGRVDEAADAPECGPDGCVPGGRDRRDDDDGREPGAAG